MQSLVNPGEAKQIEQDYAHTTLASSEMAAATAQATAEAIQAFIQSLRERLRAAQQPEQDPESEAQAPQPDDLMDNPPALAEPIEIKMGREIVYREGYAHKDPVNKLNANTLKLLRAAVDALFRPKRASSTMRAWLQVASSQSSSFNPSTRANSRVLWVTRIRLLTRAIAAICTS